MLAASIAILYDATIPPLLRPDYERLNDIQ